VTKIYSVGGLLTRSAPLIAERPFSASHYTISNAGLFGGGRRPRPGEIMLVAAKNPSNWMSRKPVNTLWTPYFPIGIGPFGPCKPSSTNLHFKSGAHTFERRADASRIVGHFGSGTLPGARGVGGRRMWRWPGRHRDAQRRPPHCHRACGCPCPRCRATGSAERSGDCSGNRSSGCTPSAGSGNVGDLATGSNVYTGAGDPDALADAYSSSNATASRSSGRRRSRDRRCRRAGEDAPRCRGGG